MSAEAPLICITSAYLSEVLGLENVEKQVLQAARRAGALCIQCVQYVSDDDLGQLGWWFNAGARVFITLDGLAAAGLYDFFNARPDAVLLSATPADSAGLDNVFLFNRDATPSQIDDAFNAATSSSTGYAQFQSNGVYLDDGYPSLLFFGATIPSTAAYVYSLTSDADADDILSDPAKVAAIQAASVVLSGRNPPAALQSVLSMVTNTALLTPYYNSQVQDRVVSNGGTMTLAQTVASHQYERLVNKLFTKTNEFVSALVNLAQIGQQLVAVVRSRVGCGNVCYVPQSGCKSQVYLSKLGILTTIFVPATLDTPALLPHVSVDIQVLTTEDL